MPAHILPGTRGCSPSGAVLVRTYVSRASSGSVGRQPAARQGFARDGERRPRTARSLGARARQRRNPARLAGRQRLIGHRFGGVGRKKHAHMHTCIQKATQHVTKHRHAVTRPCPRALSSPVSARARPLCLLPSVLQSGRRRGLSVCYSTPYMGNARNRVHPPTGLVPVSEPQLPHHQR